MLATFVPQTFVGNHDVTRIASAIDDERHLPHALVTLFTVAGTPSVYYGDEQAFRGTKEERAGGDDAIRPRFPASPADLSQLGESTYRLHQELIGLRRRHPWLVRAHTRVHTLGSAALSYTAVDPAGGSAVAVALNFGTAPVTAEVPAAPWEHAAGDALIDPGGTAVLPPLGWSVASSAVAPD
jgi:cyclomaltodextrinase